MAVIEVQYSFTPNARRVEGFLILVAKTDPILVGSLLLS